MSFFEKILNKSNSYVFYKSEYNKLKKQNNSLKNKYERDSYYFDFEDLLSKFYVSPVIKYPFSNEDKRCFAFMEYIGKYIRDNLSRNNFKPFVSIILPIHNFEENISQLITSVLNQTYNNFEFIIIDDNSNDNTVEVVESFDNDKINLIINDKTLGFSKSRNIALNKSNGEYIFYLDANNLWENNYLETMISAFFKLPDADAIYSGQYIYNNDFKDIQGIIFGENNKSLLYNNQFISLSAFAHKKELPKRLCFDESLNNLEDYQFILNVSKYCKIYSVPVILSKFNTHLNLTMKGLKYDKKEIDRVHKTINNNITCDFSKKYSLKKRISIIIPSFNLLDDLKECIDAILSFKSPLIDIIVIDNNSDDLIKNFLQEYLQEGKIKLILNEINYGFTYAVEQGISISDNDSDILLLNNDAILQKGSLEAMQYYAYTLEDCGIVVPREVLYADDSRINNNIPFSNKHFECDVTPSKIHKNIINVPLFFDGEILELNFAPFFCTYIKREVYNRTLGLDPELGRHYRSDRIFCNFVRHMLNLKIYHISQTKVYHKSQESTKKLKENKQEYNYMFIKNQWEDELVEELGYQKYIWDS